MIKKILLVAFCAGSLMAEGVFEFNTDFSSHEVSGGLTSGGANYPVYWTAGFMMADNSDDDKGTLIYGAVLKTVPMGGNFIFGYGAKIAMISGEDGARDYSGLVLPLRAKLIYRVPVKHPVRLSAEYASAPRIFNSGDVSLYDEFRLEANVRVARNLYAALGLRQLYIGGFESDSPWGNKDLFEFADGGFLGIKYYF